MQCSSLLGPPAISDGVDMNKVQTRCQSISDVQETKVPSNQNSYRTSGTSFAFFFSSFKRGVMARGN